MELERTEIGYEAELLSELELMSFDSNLNIGVDKQHRKLYWSYEN